MHDELKCEGRGPEEGGGYSLVRSAGDKAGMQGTAKIRRSGVESGDKRLMVEEVPSFSCAVDSMDSDRVVCLVPFPSPVYGLQNGAVESHAKRRSRNRRRTAVVMNSICRRDDRHLNEVW